MPKLASKSHQWRGGGLGDFSRGLGVTVVRVGAGEVLVAGNATGIGW